MGEMGRDCGLDSCLVGNLCTAKDENVIQKYKNPNEKIENNTDIGHLCFHFFP